MAMMSKDKNSGNGQDQNHCKHWYQMRLLAPNALNGISKAGNAGAVYEDRT